jgi:hypothetical protein
VVITRVRRVEKGWRYEEVRGNTWDGQGRRREKDERVREEGASEGGGRGRARGEAEDEPKANVRACMRVNCAG